MRRPRKLQIITLQVSHCFFKVSYLLLFFCQSICFKGGLYLCVQKKKRKREKAQDSGGEMSNHFPDEQRGDAITEGSFADLL